VSLETITADNVTSSILTGCDTSGGTRSRDGNVGLNDGFVVAPTGPRWPSGRGDGSFIVTVDERAGSASGRDITGACRRSGGDAGGDSGRGSGGGSGGISSSSSCCSNRGTVTSAGARLGLAGCTASTKDWRSGRSECSHDTCVGVSGVFRPKILVLPVLRVLGVDLWKFGGILLTGQFGAGSSKVDLDTSGIKLRLWLELETVDR
jgi:hypothetical protein